MKQNKLVIAVLVIIAVLFVLGLSSGVFRDKDDKDDELSMSKAEELKNGWLSSLDGAMAPFSHALDGRRLTPRAQCRIGDKTYKLTAERDECDIIIAKKDGADVEKAVLSVKPGNVKVMVPYPDDEPCPRATRGSSILFRKKPHFKAISGISEIKPGRAPSGASQQPLSLSVIYIPAGGDEKETKLCEVTGDVNLMVLDKGGTLRLECEGCGSEQSVTVKLK